MLFALQTFFTSMPKELKVPTCDMETLTANHEQTTIWETESRLSWTSGVHANDAWEMEHRSNISSCFDHLSPWIHCTTSIAQRHQLSRFAAGTINPRMSSIAAARPFIFAPTKPQRTSQEKRGGKCVGVEQNMLLRIGTTEPGWFAADSSARSASIAANPTGKAVASDLSSRTARGSGNCIAAILWRHCRPKSLHPLSTLMQKRKRLQKRSRRSA